MVTFDIVALVVACSFLLVLQRAVGQFRMYRGPHVVVCPATGRPAGVRLIAWRTMIPSLGKPRLRVRKCSNWPARRACDQVCVRKIALPRQP